MFAAFWIMTFIWWSIWPGVLPKSMFSICNPVSYILCPTDMSESSFSMLAVFHPLSSVLVSVCICICAMSVHSTIPPLTIIARAIRPNLLTVSILFIVKPLPFVTCSVIEYHFFSKFSLLMFFLRSLVTWSCFPHGWSLGFCLWIVFKLFIFILRQIFLVCSDAPFCEIIFTLIALINYVVE